jgi:hypothetical protein
MTQYLFLSGYLKRLLANVHSIFIRRNANFLALNNVSPYREDCFTVDEAMEHAAIEWFFTWRCYYTSLVHIHIIQNLKNQLIPSLTKAINGFFLLNSFLIWSILWALTYNWRETVPTSSWSTPSIAVCYCGIIIFRWLQLLVFYKIKQK